MTILIETHDLNNLICGINNAIVAYNDIFSAKFLGCECPLKWEKVSTETMQERLKELHYIYDQLLTLEGEVGNEE